MEIACTAGKRQSKRCFFERKNQKTLTHSGWASAERPKPVEQKPSFFQKKKAFLLLALPATAYLGSSAQAVGRLSACLIRHDGACKGSGAEQRGTLKAGTGRHACFHRSGLGCGG
jgi:hypothetical protein